MASPPTLLHPSTFLLHRQICRTIANLFIRLRRGPRNRGKSLTILCSRYQKKSGSCGLQKERRRLQTTLRNLGLDGRKMVALLSISVMTYEETVFRMVRLMFVSHEKRWVDNSLRNLPGDWLRCMEEQFVGVNGGVKSLQNFSSLDDPLPFVKRFFEAYPLAAEQLLAARIYHLCTY